MNVQFRVLIREWSDCSHGYARHKLISNLYLEQRQDTDRRRMPAEISRYRLIDRQVAESRSTARSVLECPPSDLETLRQGFTQSGKTGLSPGRISRPARKRDFLFRDYVVKEQQQLSWPSSSNRNGLHVPPALPLTPLAPVPGLSFDAQISIASVSRFALSLQGSLEISTQYFDLCQKNNAGCSIIITTFEYGNL